MVEGELTAGGPGALTGQSLGMQGLFAAIQARGNVQVGFSASSGLDSFDAILRI